MLRVDIDGKTDYTVNSAGRLFKTVVEGSTDDRLMSTRSGVESITVNDKKYFLECIICKMVNQEVLKLIIQHQALRMQPKFSKFGA